MPIIAIDAKTQTLKLLLDRYYRGLSDAQTPAVTAALLKANPKIFDLEPVPVGTVVFLPSEPVPVTTDEKDQTITRSFYASLSDALAGYGKELAEKFEVREKELKPTPELVKELTEKLGDDSVPAKIDAAVKAETTQLKERRAIAEDAIVSLRKDLKILINGLP